MTRIRPDHSGSVTAITRGLAAWLVAGVAATGCRGPQTEPQAAATPQPASPTPTRVADSGSASAAGGAGLAHRTADPAELRNADAFVVLESPWSGEEIGGGLDGSVLSTRNYRLHSTLRDDTLEKILPRYMEAAFAHYRTEIVELPLPVEPLKTFVFGSRSELNRFTEAPLPAREAAAMKAARAHREATCEGTRWGVCVF